MADRSREYAQPVDEQSLAHGLAISTTRRTALLGSLVAASAVAAPLGLLADDSQALIELYKHFSSAQNSRDLDLVRQMLSARPDFLWISDGQPFWGRDAMIARMANFQTAEVWRVEPEYASARVVMTGSDSGYLHIPLVLVLGSTKAPARLRWLVAMLCVRERSNWKIAALFTTEDKRP